MMAPRNSWATLKITHRRTHWVRPLQVQDIGHATGQGLHRQLRHHLAHLAKDLVAVNRGGILVVIDRELESSLIQRLGAGGATSLRQGGEILRAALQLAQGLKVGVEFLSLNRAQLIPERAKVRQGEVEQALLR